MPAVSIVPHSAPTESRYRASIRSVSQWERLLDSAPIGLVAEWIMRDLSGYRLMGPRNYLPRDLIQLQNALKAWQSIATKHNGGSHD